MTRETKIGLLVGLAFIIIVGILLSEPLNHAGDAQPAPLPNAGQNVRVAVNSPGAATATPAPPISLQTQPGGATAQQPVPTENEVTKRTGGISIVVGGGPSAGGSNSAPISMQPPQQGSTTTLSNNNAETDPAPQPQQQQQTRQVVARRDEAAPAGRPHTAPPSNVGGDPIMQEAHDGGAELVPIGTRPEPGNVGPQGRQTAAGNAKGRQYEAAAGDTLWKIAQKFYGSPSKANRDAIVAANPSLKADPNKIIPGQSYVIPAVAGESNVQPTKPEATQSPKGEPKVATNQPPAAKPSAPSPGTFYTVKAGDNLWAIARDQCGDPAAVAAIKELNKDTLKGADGVRPGMKLRLPNKPVASAN